MKAQLLSAGGSTSRIAPKVSQAASIDTKAKPVDQDRFDRSAKPNPAATSPKPETPKIFGLVTDYDTNGIRAHLEAHPEQANQVNAAGDRPLHLAAARGAVIVAEVLDDFGASHLYGNRLGLLPGYLAAKDHPSTAKFLFDRALAVKAVEGPYRSVEVVEKAINSIYETQSAPPSEKIDELAAKLVGRKLSELNAPTEVVKNRTHLERIKGKVLEQKGEGWWQDRFAEQRIRSLLRAAASSAHDPQTPKTARKEITEEIQTQLELLRVARRILALRECKSPTVRAIAARVEAKRLTARILGSAGEETTLPLGWAGHAIYGGFKRVPASEKHPVETLLIRIDNLGSGLTQSHDKDDSDLVHSRTLHVPMSELESEAGRKELFTFLTTLLAIKASSESKGDEFYAEVARYKSKVKETAPLELVESRAGVLDDDAQPRQIAGNCVVENTFRGLQNRLGSDVYNWFVGFEQKLARELVTAHADTNKIIDEACEERDRAQLDKILEGAGPWFNKLDKLASDLIDAPYADKLASKLDAKTFAKIIDASEAKSVRLLLAFGASIDRQDDRDQTPLHWAAKAGNAEIVADLLARGASPNAMDIDGSTPLHVAIEGKSSPAVIQLLLEKGADPSRKNKAGETAQALIQKQVDQTLKIAKTLGVGETTAKTGRRAAV